MFDINNAFSDTFLEKESSSTLWGMISKNYDIDEDLWLSDIIKKLEHDNDDREIADKAIDLITQVRNDPESVATIDALLLQYSLDTKEGILLMCLAESLLRIPDNKTADALIKDKIGSAEWEKHLNQNESILVNASTWGILLTSKIIDLSNHNNSFASLTGKLVNKIGKPIIRNVIYQVMKIMGKHFVLGRNINEALKNSSKSRTQGYAYSFDMLGEAAVTQTDASRYFQEYQNAINSLGEAKKQQEQQDNSLSISIKLSALHPRYEESQKEKLLVELVPIILKLIKCARSFDIALTIDAEEQDRLELMLEIFQILYNHEISKGWGKLGLVIQSYGKRAIPALCWLITIARDQGDKIPVRLVKGAYWDSEIKHSQQLGLDNYPVYTRKEAADISYLVCTKLLVSTNAQGKIVPQFASHNAHTIASVNHFVKLYNCQEYEFQRLHGMGKSLYNKVIADYGSNVRVYAPVGTHEDLLPYLVRRLLENGANSSFVHQLLDSKIPATNLVQHPITTIKQHKTLSNDKIPLPPNIFGNQRKNSHGYNINIYYQRNMLKEGIMKKMSSNWQYGSIINGINKLDDKNSLEVVCAYNKSAVIGNMSFSGATDIEEAVACATDAFPKWNATPVQDRAELLCKFADILEENKEELMSMCHQDAGKTIQDSIDEIREAVDFCRYYAAQAQIDFNPVDLPGPTGEKNQLQLFGRGAFLCISPWNFPLAIFVGQIVAALIAGNTVIAKPAEQTSLIAAKTIELMHAAGFPVNVVNLLIAKGSLIGKTLIPDERIAGVAFTGSTETAQLINRGLANRNGAIVPFIAETGGQNAMIVDSTSLLEQVAQDVATSAFSSAGQRCSALRVLYLQNDIADRVIELLKGIMEMLIVGNPSLHRTDIGPVIDSDSKEILLSHITKMKQQAKLVAEANLPEYTNKANYVAPVAFEIDNISQLEKEVFGPVLHIIRYQANDLEQIINDINNTGFGLTLGIHSRDSSSAQKIYAATKAGNVYVNRNQIGATVGVQPFGGQGLSGTGPKAGGPNYLKRFAVERTLTINTTAIGGNPELLSI